MGDLRRIIGFVEKLAKDIQKDFPNLGRGAMNNLFFPAEIIPKIINAKPDKYGAVENPKILESAIRVALKGNGDIDGLIEDEYEEFQANLQERKFPKTGLAKLTKDENMRYVLEGSNKKNRENGTIWSPEDIRYLNTLVKSAFCLNEDGRINYQILQENINHLRPEDSQRTKVAIQDAVKKFFPQYVKSYKNNVDWKQRVSLGGLEEMSLREFADTLSQRDIYRLPGGRINRKKLASRLNKIRGLDVEGEITPEMVASEFRRAKKGEDRGYDVKLGAEEIRYMGVLVRSGFCRNQRGSLDYDIICENMNYSRPKRFKRTRSSIESKIKECFASEINVQKNRVDWKQEIEIVGKRYSLIEYADYLSSLDSYRTRWGKLDRAGIAEELNRVASDVEGEITKEMFARVLNYYNKDKEERGSTIAA